ncbi:interferon gamma receptor 1 [Perognathus longimembris pacificus]|uniref:interferon gamma receptor 1 n=1 Tax=Perognathus longimembris pacificus TaxID=214514 RepID=UPI00201914D3|nr:interferon gamma receptor 1 [Perognathus longimembris pacificus]
MDLETIGDSMTPLVVFLIVMVQAGSGAVTSRADPELSSVPLPAGVIISAYNLNPVLCWEYQNMTQEPVFTVQVKNYRDGEWHDACTNVSDHCCSIFNQVDDPADPLWARVKATVGQRESAYVQSKEFILCKQGEIGPPTLNVRRKEDEIIADIFHPLVEINEEVEGIMYEAMYEGSCHTFDYNVYLRVNGSKSLIPKHVHADNCNETQCQLSIPVSSLDSEYCISVQGVSGEWAVATERTKEVCITISSSSVRDSIWIPVVTVLIPFLVIIPLLVYYLMKNPFRKNIMLPKSLISVVRNVTSETKPESKYTSLITSCQPLVPENETVICGEEQASSATVPGLHTQDNLGTAGNTEELAGEIKVLTPEENISDLVTCGPLTPLNKENSTPSDSNQSEPFSFTLNSSHSRNAYDSGLMGSDSLVSDSEFLPNNKAEVKSEGQEPITLRNAPTSFGYDKPHVLVDVIVDEGKESLIGYQPTTGSDEFS